MINIATKPEPGVEYLAPHPCHAPSCKEAPAYQVPLFLNKIKKKNFYNRPKYLGSWVIFSWCFQNGYILTTTPVNNY